MQRKALVSLVTSLCLVGFWPGSAAAARLQKTTEPNLRPNILWLSSEDNGQHLGAYGDEFADTPNLDALARRGLIYRNAWTNAPVCAPARTTVISGLYPTSTGSSNMRSRAALPPGMRFFPQILREHGYYTTNNSKEDYNLDKPGQVWDESSTTAHWKNRPSGAPFFAVFNVVVTHESQIRRRPHTAVHDPAGVDLPAYYPDTPEIRRDWAQYYDKMTEMDQILGARLAELEAADLADDTIVVYWGDHGIGLPRGKRTVLDSGLRVPMIVSIPDKFAHTRPPEYRTGGESERLVGFIDLAPSMLALVGLDPPVHYQGRAFLGASVGPSKPYLFGYRDRMDERYDLVRALRDRRFIYVRHFMPHRARGEFLDYMFQTDTTRVWYDLFEKGDLPEWQRAFWQVKPVEELYDLDADPDELVNLAHDPDYGDRLETLRAALHHKLLETRDLAFLGESEMWRRAKGRTPLELGREDYPIERILYMAELASDRRLDDSATLERLVAALEDPDPSIRSWGAIGFLVRGRPAVEQSVPALVEALEDSSPSVRTHAAEALYRYGPSAARVDAVAALVDITTSSLDALAGQPEALYYLFEAVQALNALSAIDDLPDSALDRISAIEPPLVPPKVSSHVPRLLERILALNRGD